MAFDWYSLDAMPSRLQVSFPGDPPHPIPERQGDLEQLNFLGDYQDPELPYSDVDFWLEPRETCDVAVPLWLAPGLYAAKALFLGPQRVHREEEFWSCMHVFEVPARAAG